jgi:hypothetical protein
MTDFDGLAAKLRSSANGDCRLQAAVELLVWHEHWLRRADFRRAAMVVRPGGAYINWAKAREFADRVTAGGLDAPRASTSEAAILDLAVALGEDRFRLANFGTAHRRMVAHAVVAAVGLADPKEWPFS